MKMYFHVGNRMHRSSCFKRTQVKVVTFSQDKKVFHLYHPVNFLFFFFNSFEAVIYFLLDLYLMENCYERGLRIGSRNVKFKKIQIKN